jgi:mono/diheme cytochrome c family protein
MCLTPAVLCGVLALSAAAKAEDTVSFRNEVLPLLARQGCSSASCHGSPKGKGELQLSLWGLDVESDFKNLAEEDAGRRANKSDPASSLLLAKPSRTLPHKGGLRLPKDGPAYQLLKKWIASGCVKDDAAPQCVKIEVQPPSPLRLKSSDSPVELKVSAVFSDGSRRDITHLAVFAATNEAIATVTAGGIVSPWTRGLAAVNVRYENQLQTVFVTVADEVQGFTWSAPQPANYIDELVYKQLQELQLLPASLCTDEEFLRRVHLDLVGVLPEPKVTREFLADSASDKRTKLIDALLGHADHARFWAQRWGDLLQIKFQSMGPSSLAYAKWLEEAWAKNLPYDQFVTELVTAEGLTTKEPKANFYRLGADHYETMEAAAVVLMGARVQCARCHNHPQEKWTQSDYHGLRHFFHRMTVEGEKEKTEVRLGPDVPVKFPDSDRVIPAWLPGAGQIELKADEDRRQHFARWLSAKDNPYLARVEVNRLWSHLLGRGIVEPYDDVRETNPPLNPPLLDALAKDFQDHAYDRRHILRTILLSNTYQASTRPANAAASGPVAAPAGVFPKHVQPFLAKHCAACHAADDPQGGIDLGALQEKLHQPAEISVWSKVMRQLTLGQMPPDSEAQPTAEERRQVVAWIRGALGDSGHAPHEETYFSRYRPRRLGAEQTHDAISHVTGVAGEGGRATNLLVPDQGRSNEFLQTFGQPPRSSTCSCERPADSNLGEALALYNGKHVQEKLKNSNTRFRRAIREKKTDAAIIEDLFLAAFCRLPSTDELAAAEKYVQSRPHRELAYEDLCWALITTNEFLTQH